MLVGSSAAIFVHLISLLLREGEQDERESNLWGQVEDLLIFSSLCNLLARLVSALFFLLCLKIHSFLLSPMIISFVAPNPFNSS